MDGRMPDSKVHVWRSNGPARPAPGAGVRDEKPMGGQRHGKPHVERLGLHRQAELTEPRHLVPVPALEPDLAADNLEEPAPLNLERPAVAW
jgi:hypothetical protein